MKSIDPNLLTELGNLMLDQRETLIEVMRDQIAEADPILADPETNDLFMLSIAGNVHTMIDIMRSGQVPDTIPEVPDAIAYATAVANREVPASSLRRAYHTGSQTFLNEVFQEIEKMSLDSNARFTFLHQMTTWVYAYVDRITNEVMDAYELARQSAADKQANAVLNQIRQLLSGEFTDLLTFERITEYRVNQFHIAAVIRISGVGPAVDQLNLITEVADDISKTIGAHGKPLIAPIDRSSAQVWFGRRSNREPVETYKVRKFLNKAEPVQIAFGRVLHGPIGFRESLDGARKIAQLNQISQTPAGRVLSYEDDGTWIIARAAEDLDELRFWVADVLGPLALDSQDAERNRETLKVFLDTHGSYSEAARLLMLHRNSVKYRLDRIEELIGSRADTHRTDTRTALLACELIGRPVLSD